MHCSVHAATVCRIVLRELTPKATKPDAFVFPARDETRMSRDAVAARLALHSATAAEAAPELHART